MTSKVGKVNFKIKLNDREKKKEKPVSSLLSGTTLVSACSFGAMSPLFLQFKAALNTGKISHSFWCAGSPYSAKVPFLVLISGGGDFWQIMSTDCFFPVGLFISVLEKGHRGNNGLVLWEPRAGLMGIPDGKRKVVTERREYRPARRAWAKHLPTGVAPRL